MALFKHGIISVVGLSFITTALYTTHIWALDPVPGEEPAPITNADSGGDDILDDLDRLLEEDFATELLVEDVDTEPQELVPSELEVVESEIVEEAVDDAVDVAESLEEDILSEGLEDLERVVEESNVEEALEVVEQPQDAESLEEVVSENIESLIEENEAEAVDTAADLDVEESDFFEEDVLDMPEEVTEDEVEIVEQEQSGDADIFEDIEDLDQETVDVVNQEEPSNDVYDRLYQNLQTFLGDTIDITPIPISVDGEPLIQEEVELVAQEVESEEVEGLEEDDVLFEALDLSEDVMEEEGLEELLEEEVAVIDELKSAVEADNVESAAVSQDVSEVENVTQDADSDVVEEVAVEDDTMEEEKSELAVVEEIEPDLVEVIIEDSVDNAEEEKEVDNFVEKEIKGTLEEVVEGVARQAEEDTNRSIKRSEEYAIDRATDRRNAQQPVEEVVYDENGEEVIVVGKKPRIDISLSTRKAGQKNIDIDQEVDSAYKAMVSGQTEAAINIYKRILDVKHDHKTALFGLATAYHRNNQLSQARAIYLEILQIYPNHQKAMNNYMSLIAKENPKQALEGLKIIADSNKSYSPVLAQIAMVYLQLGDLSQAKLYLTRAINLTPDNASYLYNYAVVLDRMGDTRQAKIFYQRLLKEVDKGAVIVGSVEKVERRLKYLKSKSD